MKYRKINSTNSAQRKKAAFSIVLRNSVFLVLNLIELRIRYNAYKAIPSRRDNIEKMPSNIFPSLQ